MAQIYIYSYNVGPTHIVTMYFTYFKCKYMYIHTHTHTLSHRSYREFTYMCMYVCRSKMYNLFIQDTVSYF